MSRNVAEITFMAAKLKENGYRIPGHTESVAENIIQEAEQVRKEKVKTKKSAAATAPSNETLWTQEQQQALEAAITKYPKASSGDRWAKIANNVPGKTREECLQRYKYLVELVKSQREAKKSESETNQQTEEVADDGGVNAEETVSNATETSNVEEIEEEVEEVEEEIVQPVKNKGKPRNKRKERKKRMEFSSDEDDYSDWNFRLDRWSDVTAQSKIIMWAGTTCNKDELTTFLCKRCVFSTFTNKRSNERNGANLMFGFHLRFI